MNIVLMDCRLEELQQSMVGGEMAHNEEVKERRRKKKKYAEERRKKLIGCE
jgi:kinesin family member 17